MAAHDKPAARAFAMARCEASALPIARPLLSVYLLCCVVGRGGVLWVCWVFVAFFGVFCVTINVALSIVVCLYGHHHCFFYCYCYYDNDYYYSNCRIVYDILFAIVIIIVM